MVDRIVSELFSTAELGSTNPIWVQLEQEEVEMARGQEHPAEQIVNHCGNVENGKTVQQQACKKATIVEQTYYRWRREYGGFKIDQARWPKKLEQENATLKRLVSELSLY